MGFTLRQIFHCYDEVVSAYETMGFKIESDTVLSTSSLSSDYRIYKSTRLLTDNITSVISLVEKYNDNIPGFKLPANTLSIITKKFVNDDHIITEYYKQFYHIDGVYFTTNLEELKHAQDVAFRRYSCSHSHKIIHLDLNKISDRLMRYVKKAIDERINNSYYITDIYFSYGFNLNRDLVVTIKRDNDSSTELIYFNPSCSLLSFE